MYIYIIIYICTYNHDYDMYDIIYVRLCESAVLCWVFEGMATAHQPVNYVASQIWANDLARRPKFVMDRKFSGSKEENMRNDRFIWINHSYLDYKYLDKL